MILFGITILSHSISLILSDDWIENVDGTFILRGNCSIYTLGRALKLHVACPEQEVDTVAGLIMHQLGRFPLENECIEFMEFSAVIKKVDGSKIQTIKIWPKSLKLPCFQKAAH